MPCSYLGSGETHVLPFYLGRGTEICAIRGPSSQWWSWSWSQPGQRGQPPCFCPSQGERKRNIFNRAVLGCCYCSCALPTKQGTSPKQTFSNRLELKRLFSASPRPRKKTNQHTRRRRFVRATGGPSEHLHLWSARHGCGQGTVQLMSEDGE